jgi:hypothetical protein
MSTKRQSILSNIKTTLQNITAIKTVLLSKLSISDLETYPYPICFIFSGGESKTWENGVLAYETWIWPVYIEVWALDTDMETYLGSIHNEMAKDETRGGYALKCERVGSSAPWLVDPDDNLAGMLLEFQIMYRHVEGTA